MGGLPGHCRKAFIGLAFAAALLGAAISGRSASAQTSPSAAQCESAWAEADRARRRDVYEQFLELFPQCPQAAQARAALNATAPPSQPGTETEERGPNGEKPRERATDVYLPVGRYLRTEAQPVAEGGGYGMVLLRRSTSRNAEACDAFRRAMVFTQDALDGRPQIVDGGLVYQRPIYWPVESALPDSDQATCSDMLRRYDYERARIRMLRLARTEGPGPFLAIYRESGREVGLFDFSNVPSDEFALQFEAFLNAMSAASEAWAPGTYVEASLRQRLRYALGEQAATITLAAAMLLPIEQASANDLDRRGR